MAYEKPEYGDRVTGGGIGGALAAFLLSRGHKGKAALLGGLGGAGANAIGYGIDDDPVAGGAMSGGLLGGAAGVAATGSAPGGGALIKQLMASGMSKRAAIAKVLGLGGGIGAGVGSLTGAAGGGIEKLLGGE